MISFEFMSFSINREHEDEGPQRRGFHLWRPLARGRSSCCLLPSRSPNIRKTGVQSCHRRWAVVAVAAMADSVKTEVVQAGVEHLL